jgi:D-alanyl-D-alanine carboxypeptidase/D-alanyl-D-alanine-endopeptidase (penicillin-binding protein 4)
VVVTTGSVHVTVLDLFGSRFAHVVHFNREMQCLASERMIAVDEYLAILDPGHGDIDLTLRTTTLKLHAGLDVFDALKRLARHFLHQLGVVHAIAFLGRHVGSELVADCTAFHLRFQTRHDLAGAVDIGQRITAFRAVDDLTLVVGQRVMKGGNGVFCNLHMRLTNRFKSADQMPARAVEGNRRRRNDLQSRSGLTILQTMIVLKSRTAKQLAALILLTAAGTLILALAATPPERGATTAAALSAQIAAQIDQPRFAAAAWGIAVVSLDSGRTLYARNADQLLQPASTAKLFTAAVSLSTLGPDYRMATQLLASGKIVKGRLHGPLILYGKGDPTLGTESSEDWADQLASQAAARGLRLVRGELIADDTWFAGPAHGSGWEAEDLQSWFAVPSSALSIDENVARVTITSGTASGQPARLTVTPQEAFPAIDGRLLTTARHTADNINLYRGPGEQTLHVFGSVSADTRPREFKLAMTDPARVAALQLRQALKNRGIRVTGKLRMVHWPQISPAPPEQAQLMGRVLSPQLSDILGRGLKRSQNLYLQNLLLGVGATQPPPAAAEFVSTERRGIDALRRLLDQIGIPPSASLIGEGTGLSRRDLVTPNAMVRLVSYLADQPYADMVRAALPIAGVDGTLIDHMRRTAAENNVHAKTGSMTYVHCMAGYVTSAAGEHLAFAIMLNNYEAAAGAPRASGDLDAIATALANYRGEK